DLVVEPVTDQVAGFGIGGLAVGIHVVIDVVVAHSLIGLDGKAPHHVALIDIIDDLDVIEAQVICAEDLLCIELDIAVQDNGFKIVEPVIFLGQSAETGEPPVSVNDTSIREYDARPVYVSSRGSCLRSRLMRCKRENYHILIIKITVKMQKRLVKYRKDGIIVLSFLFRRFRI
ncbi:MAG: hypothetical protein IJL20_04820, partial [Lachnospiraceae bacterium]|nr:hypothetical protein [Lachnospiraceae bacterium]